MTITWSTVTCSGSRAPHVRRARWRTRSGLCWAPRAAMAAAAPRALPAPCPPPATPGASRTACSSWPSCASWDSVRDGAGGLRAGELRVGVPGRALRRSLLPAGSYFCYDNPAALQTQVQRVSPVRGLGKRGEGAFLWAGGRWAGIVPCDGGRAWHRVREGLCLPLDPCKCPFGATGDRGGVPGLGTKWNPVNYRKLFLLDSS